MTVLLAPRFEKNMQRLNAKVEALQREVGEIRYDLGRFDLPADFDQRVVDYSGTTLRRCPGYYVQAQRSAVLPYVER